MLCMWQTEKFSPEPLWMGTKYVYVTPNCNSKVDEPTNHNYSEIGNSVDCGNHEQSQSTSEPLSIAEQVLFKTIKAIIKKS